ECHKNAITNHEAALLGARTIIYHVQRLSRQGTNSFCLNQNTALVKEPLMTPRESALTRFKGVIAFISVIKPNATDLGLSEKGASTAYS
ncbi:hypothetical protein CEXT_232191, partial [Caerostris extrusa]